MKKISLITLLVFLFSLFFISCYTQFKPISSELNERAQDEAYSEEYEYEYPYVSDSSDVQIFNQYNYFTGYRPMHYAWAFSGYYDYFYTPVDYWFYAGSPYYPYAYYDPFYLYNHYAYYPYVAVGVFYPFYYPYYFPYNLGYHETTHFEKRPFGKRSFTGSRTPSRDVVPHRSVVRENTKKTGIRRTTESNNTERQRKVIPRSPIRSVFDKPSRNNNPRRTTIIRSTGSKKSSGATRSNSSNRKRKR